MVPAWRFASSFGKIIELTHERWEHIALYHADIVPFLDRLNAVLAHPDEVRRSLDDPQVNLFYKYYPDILGGKYVVVVVKVGEERNFVLTAYLTGSVKTGALL
jgi:hypothetical protein